jgi:ABC-2 type transport system permease protein
MFNFTTFVHNVYYLCFKEIRGLISDATLMVLMLFTFTVGIISPSKGWKVEVSDAPVGIIDYDQSRLSKQFRDALIPPLFKAPIIMGPELASESLRSGKIIFLIEIPPNFEANVLARRQPAIQIQSDATAMTQAAFGSIYIQEIFSKITKDYLYSKSIYFSMPFKINIRNMFNQNANPSWFISTMQVVTNITVVTIVIVGSAFIREKERGTLEHLLVMPINASQIILSKLLANAFVIFIITCLSFYFIVNLYLNVPLSGSVILYNSAIAIYLVSAGSVGLLLATLAPTMPQFALLVVPVYTVTYLLSGAATPVESMPSLLQIIANSLPMTKFVGITNSVVLQGGGFEYIKYDLLYISTFSIILIMICVSRFKSILSRQS